MAHSKIWKKGGNTYRNHHLLSRMIVFLHMYFFISLISYWSITIAQCDWHCNRWKTTSVIGKWKKKSKMRILDFRGYKKHANTNVQIKETTNAQNASYAGEFCSFIHNQEKKSHAPFSARARETLQFLLFNIKNYSPQSNTYALRYPKWCHLKICHAKRSYEIATWT